MSTAIIIYTAILFGWASLSGVDKAPWDHGAETSLSFRNAKEAFRVVDGDSIKNPTDFEIVTSYTQTRAGWTDRHSLLYEGQNAIRYWGHSNYLERKGKRTIFGISEEKSDARDRYLLNAWGELRVGFLGIGMSRNYTEPITDDGATMFRISINADKPIGAVTIVTTGTFEANTSRSHGRVRWDARGIHAGPVEIIPFFVYQRTQPKARDAIESWQGKVRFVIDF
jgi:hypothetical protein